MQIQLRQSEIETAIKQYITSMGIPRAIDSIAFTASRGNAGILAEIEIVEAETPVAETPVKAVVEAVKVVKPAPEKTAEKAADAKAEEPATKEAEKSAPAEAKSLFS